VTARSRVGAPDEPDCTSCNDTGWVFVGFEFDGTEITAPCPVCGAGNDALNGLRCPCGGDCWDTEPERPVETVNTFTERGLL
jgi:hypothetical protein